MAAGTTSGLNAGTETLYSNSEVSTRSKTAAAFSFIGDEE